MAASISVLHPQKFNPLCHNYYDPLLTSNRGALHYLPSNPTLKLIKSPLSTNTFNFTGSANRRRLPIIANVASEKSSEMISTQTNRFSQKGMRSNHHQLLHHFSLSMIWEIITFIWRLPASIGQFFKKEEKFLDEVEEDIIKSADVIKKGAKVMEEVSEGLEDLAEGLEKAAKTIDHDAKKVDEIMDKVKDKTKIAHDEIEEVVGLLDKDVAKVKESKEVKGSKEESTSTPTTVELSPSTENSNTLHYKPFQHSILVWRLQTLLHSSLDSILDHLHIESLSYLMPLPRVIFGTMLMIPFLIAIGTMPNVLLLN